MENIRVAINAKEVYENGLTGKGIGIAVLDTGAFMHHEIAENISYFKDFIRHRNKCYDDNSHGSHISGIIAADSFGIAPKAALIELKVLDESGRGNSWDIIRCLNWIIENYIRYNIRILNFSIGFTPGAGIDEQRDILGLVEKIWDCGVTVVAAAGNDGPDEFTITVPGISRKIITVGSSDPKSFGSRGPNRCCIVKPEVLAPGYRIKSISNHDGGYEYKTGTSMSTPMVSGAIALVLEKNPALRPEEIKLMLYNSCKRSRENGDYSWGTLDVDTLVALAN